MSVPKGYKSWLDYAVDEMETRGEYLDRIASGKDEMSRDDMRKEARAELDTLRKQAAAGIKLAADCMLLVATSAKLSQVKTAELYGRVRKILDLDNLEKEFAGKLPRFVKEMQKASDEIVELIKKEGYI